MGIQVENRRVGASWSTKPCDSCKSASAILFCRADSAFLCMSCDSNIHSANKLASRHERVWMCDVCESAPASVTCKADAASLCVSCDRDIHSANPLARRHERIPVVPFYESAAAAAASVNNKANMNFLVVPDHFVNDDEEEQDVKTIRVVEDGIDDAAAAAAASWLFQNPTPAKLAAEAPTPPDLMMKSGIGVGVDYLFSDVDSYLDLDYPAEIGGGEKFQNQYQNDNGSTGSDSVVPNPVQNNQYHNYCYEFDFSKPKPAYNNSTQSVSRSVSSSEVGVVPDSNCSSMTDISNPFSRNNNNVSMISDHHHLLNHGVISSDHGLIDVTTTTTTTGNGIENQVVVIQLTGVDREARVLRYREKRKNRKFEKTIRYASRKAYAETRPRIKGRFAKRTENEIEADNQIDRMFNANSTSGFNMIDSGYGIVPFNMCNYK